LWQSIDLIFLSIELSIDTIKFGEAVAPSAIAGGFDFALVDLRM